ncbi:hypothetical protein Bbelb_140170 [Branchiostoma belcheri]|nr:hypothetical protein Bbelb_140170 [Branchiostoma belcheri]
MSMDFWKLFLNKCGGSAIRLLSGWKLIGSIITTKDMTKTLSGSESNIILAIPNVSRLLSYNIEDIATANQKRPGIHDDLLSWLAQNQSPHSSFILSFDGRLVQANSGTVDLGGLELDGCTAKQREDKECQELDLCKDLKGHIDDFEMTDQEKVGSMRAIITLLSNKKQNLRLIKAKKEYALKLAKEGINGDWKKSKYARLISHLMALLHQIDSTMSLLEDSLEKLGKASAEISGAGHLWAEGPVVDMTKQENYRKLVPRSAEAEKSEETLYWQQRGANWKQLRNSVPITGSQLHKGAGCDTLSDAKRLFKRWTDGEQLPEPSDKVKTAMEAGVENEPHAVATIVSKFLPSLYPTLEFREVGCCKLLMGNVNIVDSPDGSAHEQNSDLKSPSRFAIEIKHVTTDIPRHVRHYNILQCMAHCKALQTDSCMLFYHTKTSTALYNVGYDEQLWKMITDQVESIYGSKGSIPKRVTPEVKCLRERVILFRSIAEGSELVAEFRSAINVELGPYIREEDSPYYQPRGTNKPATFKMSDAVNACDKAIAALKECHDLEKPYAKEVLQFLLCDTDRMWSKNQIYGCPAAYFLKGPSLCATQAHVLVDAVLRKAEEKGLHIPAISADGAFEYMVGRDSMDHPNTKLSFQKSLWKQMSSIEKRSLVKILCIQISDAWNVPMEKMKISQLGMSISVERQVKKPCPRTATWVLKSIDDKNSKTKSDKPSMESDIFEQLLLSVPDDVRRNLEDFVEENPSFREQLSKHQNAEWISDAQGNSGRNADNAKSTCHTERSQADDMNAEVFTENEHVDAPECSQASEVNEVHVSSDILEQVKQKILEKTSLHLDPGIETRAYLQDTKMLNKLNLDVLKDILRTMKSKEMCDVLFSAEVASELYRIGYKSTADFVMAMHGWYRANDCPGLDAKERVLLRLRMRDWLLDGVDFDVYPPPGRYVKGIYVTTWEAFVSQIDLSIQAARVPAEVYRSSTCISCTRG